jgi:hypothetical protein
VQLTPEQDRERRKVYRRRWYDKNKAAILERQRAYQVALPVEQRREIQKRYRLKHGDKERARARAKNWRAQGCPQPTRAEPSACECCGKSDKRSLALDHCHETGAFRGWLCSGCNLGLGKLGDTIESVQRALDYLKRAAK